MNNFYGRRFLSSLLGALSVLGSPVASARDDKLGKGSLKGEVGSSAGRGKNNGKLGGLRSNRKVKGVENLKKVLKETGGKVVGVSPDGKGGFVAFIETPTGKVVALAIVGVPLVVIISWLVGCRRKNDGAGGKNAEIVVENAAEKLLSGLFGDNRGRYDSFVGKLLEVFFNDERVKKIFVDCGRNLDEFLRLVFSVSGFQVRSDASAWTIYCVDGTVYRVIYLGMGLKRVAFEGLSIGFLDFYRNVVGYLFRGRLVEIPGDGKEASWEVKIASVLFAVWCLVEFNLDVERDADIVKKKLAERSRNDLSGTFNAIRDYVGDRLSAAGRDYNGQEEELVDDNK